MRRYSCGSVHTGCLGDLLDTRNPFFGIHILWHGNDLHRGTDLRSSPDLHASRAEYRGSEKKENFWAFTLIRIEWAALVVAALTPLIAEAARFERVYGTLGTSFFDSADASGDIDLESDGTSAQISVGRYLSDRDRIALEAIYSKTNTISPHIAPRAAMIAEDFCRLRVLARSPQPGSARGYLSQKQEHSPAYGGASMCAQTAKRPARARPAQFVSATTSGHSEVVQTKQTTFVNSMSGLGQYAGWCPVYRRNRTIRSRPPVRSGPRTSPAPLPAA